MLVGTASQTCVSAASILIGGVGPEKPVAGRLHDVDFLPLGARRGLSARILPASLKGELPMQLLAGGMAHGAHGARRQRALRRAVGPGP